MKGVFAFPQASKLISIFLIVVQCRNPCQINRVIAKQSIIYLNPNAAIMQIMCAIKQSSVADNLHLLNIRSVGGGSPLPLYDHLLFCHSENALNC